jgi:hypothetical protein
MEIPLIPLGGPLDAAAAAAAAAAAGVAAAAIIQEAINQFRPGVPPLAPEIGRAGGPTLADLIDDARAGARVPAGVVPPGAPQPFNPVGDLLEQLADQIKEDVSQVWGMVNKPTGREVPTIPIVSPDGDVTVTGERGGLSYPTEYRIKYGAFQYIQGSQCQFIYDTPANEYSDWFSLNGAVGGITEEVQKIGSSPCGKADYIEVFIELLNGERKLIGGISGAPFTFWSFEVDFRTTDPNPLPMTATEDRGGSAPYLPQLVPFSPEALPALPLPGGDPFVRPQQVPEAQPIEQPTPDPGRRVVPNPAVPIPGPAPSSPPWISPSTPGAPSPAPNQAPSPSPGTFPGPATVPISPAGVPVAPAPLPVPVTPTGSVYPIPGGPPLVDNGPRADLQAIATELGRMEQKLHGLMNPTSPLNPSPEWLDDLFRMYERFAIISDLLTLDTNGITYRLQAPCDRDEEGQFLEWEQQIPPADYLPAIVGRLDALMDAIDKLNTWKRTVCRTPQPVGNVTITAYEITEE